MKINESNIKVIVNTSQDGGYFLAESSGTVWGPLRRFKLLVIFLVSVGVAKWRIKGYVHYNILKILNLNFLSKDY